MKVYKKSVLLLGMAMLSGGIRAMETKEAVESKIRNTAENFWAVDNMFDLSDLEGRDGTSAQKKGIDWVNAYYDLKVYVGENAQENRKLLKAGSLAHQAASNLFNIIWKGYKVGFVVGDFTRYQKMEKNILNLLKNKEELERDKKKLADDPFWFGKKRKARNLLIWAITLLLTSIKITVEEFLEKSQESKFYPTPNLLGKVENAYPDYEFEL